MDAQSSFDILTASDLNELESKAWERAPARSPSVHGRAPARARSLDAVLRGRDIAVSLAAIVVAFPLLVLIAVLIKLDSRGSWLFVQRRGGLNGRPFNCMKFRTLTVLEDGETVCQVAANDARVTRVGRFLRRTSLDELPQLFNVLAGDMALVGPRPHALAHDAQFAALVPAYAERFSVKPGMTGFAQVMGLRGTVAERADVERRVAADVAYLRNRGFWLDLRIIVATPGYVLARRTLRPDWIARGSAMPLTVPPATVTPRNEGGS